jgi:hypothetical protein
MNVADLSLEDSLLFAHVNFFPAFFFNTKLSLEVVKGF